MYCIEILPKLRSLVQDAPSLDSDPASQMSELHASGETDWPRHM